MRFPASAEALRWAVAAWRTAAPRVADPAWQAEWLRCEGTWFAGVDLLPNAPDGSVGGIPLGGPALDVLDRLGLRPARWHAAQVSVTYPGYPRAKEGESPGAARFRLRRDAAHVDGLLPEGQPPRRFLREPHAFILGIALTPAPADAAPLVVWPGSHHVLGASFAAERKRAGMPPVDRLDLTQVYAETRRALFETHPRTEIPLAVGEAVLLHRHLLHGIATWRAPPQTQGRAIAYFRPEFDEAEAWF
ncbi:MAG: phytanoyl-CoA dioxygenase family protein [Pseudomonadota bacterium]